MAPCRHFWVFLLLVMRAAAVTVMQLCTDPATCAAQWNSTAVYLQDRLQENVEFLSVPTMDQIYDIAQAGEADLFLLSGARFQCVQVAYGGGGVLSPVQTLAPGVQTKSSGQLILARADRGDLNSLADVRGMRVAAVDLISLTGFLAQWGEFRRQGVELFAQARMVAFVGTEDRVVQLLLDRETDIGFASVDAAGLQFKVLAGREYPGYPYEVSTQLYPTPLLFSAQGADDALLRGVASALLDLGCCGRELLDSGVAYWRPPLGYANVRTLLDSLAFIKTDVPTITQRCLNSSELYQAILCPAATVKGPRDEVLQCAECPAGAMCVCAPCRRPAAQALTDGGIIGVAVGGLSAVLAAAATAYAIRRRGTYAHDLLPFERLKIDLGQPPLGRSSHGLVRVATLYGESVVLKRMVASPARSEVFDAEVLLSPGFVELPVWRRAATALALPTDFTAQLRQAAVLCRLQHENVVRVLGVTTGPSGGDVVTVQALCVRGNLYDFITNRSVAMEEALMHSLAMDVARGMRYLHALQPPRLGVNIRPRHLFLDDNLRVHIGHTLKPAGTPGARQATEAALYLAPEILQGSAHSCSADVYSYGILLYFLLFRQDPYLGEAVEDVARQVADVDVAVPKRPDGAAPLRGFQGSLQGLMHACWATAPAERPSFGDIMHQLDTHSTQANSLLERALSEQARNREIMTDILPPEVVDRLQKHLPVEPTHHPCVTVFFSDIVGFTSMASQMVPGDVMRLLHRLYVAFDTLLEEHGLFKVETIGDCYMAVANLRVEQADHAVRVARFALAAVAAAREIEVAGVPVVVRAGFHSGPVVASVIGTTKPRYCLFGDTVNFASRMESTSEPGKVQMTHASALLVMRDAEMALMVMRRPGRIDVKGKGLIATYWLTGEPCDERTSFELSRRGSFPGTPVAGDA